MNKKYQHPLIAIANETFKVQIKGIIHVGAYVGDEKKEYESMGIENRLWIEADPDTYKRLVHNVAPDPTAHFAATDYDGVATFIRTNNHVSSSLFPLKDHKKVVPHVVATSTIEVPAHRLDTFLTQDPSFSKYNVMLFDIQGAELKALCGAIHCLKQIDCIIVEIQYMELYEGAPSLYELDTYLFKQGFIRADTISTNYAWGDALYIRHEK